MKGKNAKLVSFIFGSLAVIGLADLINKLVKKFVKR